MGLQDTASAPATVTIGTAAGLVLADCPGRRSRLVVQNVHASNVLYLGFGASASSVATSTGVRLAAGESYTDGGDGCYSGAVYGIASAAGTDVRVVEFL
jgi:hypothetical protein